MWKLNPIEEECKDALSIILDLMGPGKRHVTVTEHTELMGKVRDALHHLINKEYGCWSGKHTSKCTCSPDHVGEHDRAIKYH